MATSQAVHFNELTNENIFRGVAITSLSRFKCDQFASVYVLEIPHPLEPAQGCFPSKKGPDVRASLWGGAAALALGAAALGAAALVVGGGDRANTADPMIERGRQVAQACTVCHAIGRNDPPRVGPPLWGVVDAPKGRVSGFGYSAALIGAGGAWDDRSLNAFLADPQGYLPGTAMVFDGIVDGRDRASLIAYLRSQSD